MKNNENKAIEEALVDVYLSVKIRKQEEIENLNQNVEILEKEREMLMKMSPFIILEYIKNSIDILITLKVEEKLEIERNNSFEGTDEEKQNEYEVLLRKLESDIRGHIKIEHQLKLYSEGLQQKIEELERENEEKNKKYNSIKEQFLKIKKDGSFEDKREIEIMGLRKEVSNYKQILKSYEDQNLKISELENKLRNQNLKSEKDIKNLEMNYEDKIKTLNKKINYLEEKIKTETIFHKSNSNMLTHNKAEETASKTDRHELSPYEPYELSQEKQNINKNTHNISMANSSKAFISNIEKRISNEFQKKIPQFKKVHDRRANNSVSNYNSITNRSNNSNVNKSINRNDEERSVSNKSHLLTKEKSMNETSKSNLKYNTFLNNIENVAKKVISKDKFRTHYKQNSIDIRYDRSKIALPYKNIPLVKEILNNKNLTSSSSSYLLKEKKSLSKDSKGDIKKKFNTNKSNNTHSNSVLNQNGLVCFNNINIYNSHKNNTNAVKNPQGYDLNLRQYLLSKVTGSGDKIRK